MIVDASVAVQVILGENLLAQAELVMSGEDLAAPRLFRTEVGHALTKHVRRQDLSPWQARDLWGHVVTMPVELIDSDGQEARALDLSLTLRAGFYDCLYLALAEARDDVLITADGHFLNALAADRRFARRAVHLKDI